MSLWDRLRVCVRKHDIFGVLAYRTLMEKVDKYLAGLVIGSLLRICLYLSFSMFNILGKGKGRGKLTSDRKDP